MRDYSSWGQTWQYFAENPDSLHISEGFLWEGFTRWGWFKGWGGPRFLRENLKNQSPPLTSSFEPQPKVATKSSKHGGKTHRLHRIQPVKTRLSILLLARCSNEYFLKTYWKSVEQWTKRTIEKHLFNKAGSLIFGCLAPSSYIWLLSFSVGLRNMSLVQTSLLLPLFAANLEFGGNKSPRWSSRNC